MVRLVLLQPPHCRAAVSVQWRTNGPLLLLLAAGTDPTAVARPVPLDDNEFFMLFETEVITATMTNNQYRSYYDPAQAQYLNKDHPSVKAELPSEPEHVQLEEQLELMQKQEQLTRTNAR